MVCQTFSLWIEKFSGGKFSQEKKNYLYKRKLLMAKKNLTAKDKSSQQNEYSHIEGNILVAKEKLS